MSIYVPQPIPVEVYAERRKQLMAALPGKAVLLGNGCWRYRNIKAVRYPFRSSSHVLFFCSQLPPESVVLITEDETAVFLPSRPDDDEIWHGPAPDLAELKARLGVQRVSTLDVLSEELKRFNPHEILSLPSADYVSTVQIAELLGRTPDFVGADRQLALAIIELRLQHDVHEIAELRAAATITKHCFLRAMQVTGAGKYQFELIAEMNAETRRRGGEPAFLGIATNRCEILHDDADLNAQLAEDDMVLADFGAETMLGYSADVTRTWPVRGAFSGEQRAVYEIVLSAQAAAIEAVRPGRRYLDVHLCAARQLTQGLIDLGILLGSVDSLVERRAHTLFFPHGIGHLVGLDVHDLEDLGDLAGYAPGRTRAEEFGLNFLRLDRDLAAGMAVTIEPGCYFIPALLDDEQRFAPFADCVSREQLAVYRGLRGIRIEDTVLVTEHGSEVLTEAIPKDCAAIEAVVGTATDQGRTTNE